MASYHSKIFGEPAMINKYCIYHMHPIVGDPIIATCSHRNCAIFCNQLFKTKAKQLDAEAEAKRLADEAGAAKARAGSMEKEWHQLLKSCCEAVMTAQQQQAIERMEAVLKEKGTLADMILWRSMDTAERLEFSMSSKCLISDHIEH